jgi:tryptophan synthase alpha chain
MSRLQAHFQQKTHRNLNIYFTAGYPDRASIESIILVLEQNGTDLIEIGMPFSDPLADGPVIQNSGKIALEKGITTNGIFEALNTVRQKTNIPLVMMGYLNPVLQFGMDAFLERAAACGIDGLILPDLPPQVFEKDYQQLYAKYGIDPIFLITPQTTDERMRYLDGLSQGFLYAVSSSSTTGSEASFNATHLAYFERLQQLKLRNPIMIGFGISNQKALETVFSFTSGAVVGSAFVKNIRESEKDYGIKNFMNQLLNK